VESVARIGSYSTDILAGRWVSSKGLDAIFGIDAAFDRSVEGWASLFHPADREATVAYPIDEVVGRAQPFDRQYRIVRADTGEERWVHGRGVPELDGSGRPVRRLGTTADVTNQQEAQEERARLEDGLRQSERNLTEAQRIAHIGSWEWDLATDTAQRSEELYRILGVQPGAIAGTDEAFLAFVHSDDRARVQASERAVISGSGRHDLDYRIVRPDGTIRIVHEEAEVICDEHGAPVRMVGTVQDITERVQLEAREVRRARERALIADALAALRPLDTAEQTAEAICRRIVELPEIAMASLLLLEPDGSALPLALIVDDGRVLERKNLGPERSAQLRTRAGQGPWVEAWRARPGHPYLADHLAIGLRAQAYAPIRSGTTLIGLLTVGSREPDAVALLTERLPAILEFASLAGALLAPSVALTSATAASRGHYQAIIDERAFHPVFQPIVALASGEPVGYEALTRFADGTPPDRMIADAHSVGLGLELEVACLAAALDASETLAPDCWLSLNASPDVILHPTELAALLAGRSRRFVIEVTEHVGIDDYKAVRRAVARLGPTVSLAVDDAGAGFASLRHVVELAPRFLKLDISLVRHVDRDLTRQAMIAGLSQFAARVGSEVIAEGIEESAELEMLRELGVPYGQGYLLGRPVPALAILAGGAGSIGTPVPAGGRGHHRRRLLSLDALSK
jgi:PAS domain S-box-containing protein